MATLAASLSSWIPEDDVLLKNAVQAGASLEALAKGAVRFSRKFTVQELRDRWHSLLYDPVISAEASARMVRFEVSAASKSIRPGNGVDKAEFTLKRKVDSVRKLYHASRKKICIQPLNYPNVSPLGSPNGKASIDDGTTCQDNHESEIVSSKLGAYIQNRSEFQEMEIDRLHCAPQDNKFSHESVAHDIFEHGNKHEDLSRNTEEALVDFENCPGFEGMEPSNTLPESDASFQSLGHSSPQPRTPLWKTMVDTPAPVMPINVNHEIKGQVLEVAFIPPPDDVVEKKIILPAILETDLADLSDSLLNLENDDQLHAMDADAKDVIDKSCNNCDNPKLLSCPKSTAHREDVSNINEADMCIAVVDGSNQVELEVSAGQLLTGIENQHDACNSEINVPSSSLTQHSRPHDHPEAEKECILNSEDPEIPCNDDFIPGKMVTSSAMPACHKEVSDLALSSATQKNNIKKQRKEDKSIPCFMASQMGGSDVFPGSSNDTQPFSCRVKSKSLEFNNPSSVPRNVDNDNGDPSQCRSKLATQKSVAHVVEEQDSQHACSVTDTNLSTLDQEESESGDDIPSFSDIESLILDMDLCPDDGDSCFSKEVKKYQCEDSKRTIMRLEQCARSAMQRAISYQGAFAIFYGRRLKHYIKATESVLGRATDDIDVDIDLGREGRANKISRRQAFIKMEGDGSFFLKNLGKSCMFLNGKEIATGQAASLSSSSLIEIREMAFMFEINHKYVREYVENATKRNQEKNGNFGWSEQVP